MKNITTNQYEKRSILVLIILKYGSLHTVWGFRSSFKCTAVCGWNYLHSTVDKPLRRGKQYSIYEWRDESKSASNGCAMGLLDSNLSPHGCLDTWRYILWYLAQINFCVWEKMDKVGRLYIATTTLDLVNLVISVLRDFTAGNDSFSSFSDFR